MFSANAFKSFSLIVIVSMMAGLPGPAALASGPASRPATHAPARSLAAGAQNAAIHPAPQRPPSPAGWATDGDITDTLILTATEYFDSHTYQDPVMTTADWDVFDGVLQLPHSPSGTRQQSPSIALDAAGNAYVAWEDDRNGDDDPDIYAQKLDADGYRLWPEDVRVNSDSGAVAQSYPSVVLDASGNVVVVWQDRRDTYYGIYAQKLAPDGVKLWASGDKRVDDDLVNAYCVNPNASQDPSTGDVLVTWIDGRNSNYDIYAQRLQTDGSPRWPDDMRVNSGSVDAVRSEPAVSVDAAGNAYFAWADTRNDICPDCPFPETDVYAQKLNSAGVSLWDDRRVDDAAGIGGASFNGPSIATDAEGNSTIVWRAGTIRAQRLDTYGQKLWPGDVQVNGDTGWTGGDPSVALSSGDGAFVTWGGSANLNYWVICAQRLNTNGQRLWVGDIAVNTDLTSSGANSAIAINADDDLRVAWQDTRADQGDIYLQRLDAAGTRLWPRNWQANSDVNPAQYLATAEARSRAVDSTSDNILWATLTVSATVPASTSIVYYLSNNGGATWAEVTPGVAHPFDTAGSNLRWRAILTASADQTQTPVVDWLQIQYSADPPLNSVRVENGNYQLVPGARLYRNGQFAGLTDDEGSFVFDQLQAGDRLVALQPVYEQPTVRAAHNPDGSANYAFRVYRTSFPIDGSGAIVPYVVQGSGQHHLLEVHPTNTLILLNLVVSIEWDASGEYLAEIASAVRLASDYLYDISDGQMAFGQVAIYDNSENWADADLQISTNNTVRPHAYVGGLTSSDKSHVIRVGRFWNGTSGDQGPWDQPAGFRTLIHEFGHYALYLYDEYYAYTFDENGNLTGTTPTYCTGPENRNPAADAVNASVMDYQYTASELSARGVAGMWTSSCEHTAQWQLNPTSDNYTDEGESAWETVARQYADRLNPPRWQLMPPAGRGHVMADPHDLPDDVLALPVTTITNGGTAEQTYHLTVSDPDGRGFWGAIVALYKQNGRVIGQGFTAGDGQLDIYGASAGDTIRIASFDSGLAGSVVVGSEGALSLTLHTVGGLAAQASGGIPHMRVIAEPGESPGQIDLLIFLKDFGPGADPSVIITEPNSDAGHAPIMAYTPISDTYQAQISFSATEQGTGSIRAVGAIGESLVRLQSTYRLQQVINNSDQGQDIYSNDGNLSLHLEPGSLPGNDVYIVVMPPGAVPGSLPAGQVLFGDPYDVTASGAVAEVEKPAILTLRYDKALVNAPAAPAGLGIYWWNPGSRTWQEVPGSLDEIRRVVIVPVTTLGTYALLAPPGSWNERVQIFLPIILKGGR